MIIKGDGLSDYQSSKISKCFQDVDKVRKIFKAKKIKVTCDAIEDKSHCPKKFKGYYLNFF